MIRVIPPTGTPGRSAIGIVPMEVKEHTMAFKLQRRTFLQMVAGSAASIGASAPFASAVAAGNDAVTIGWPNDVPSWDPNQRFTPDAQPIFKAVFDQPLDQDPQLKLDSASDQELEPGAGWLEHGGRASRRRDLPQWRQDDHGGFPLHLPGTHQVRSEARHRELLAQGGGHRHRIADQGDDEIQLTGTDRSAVDGVPRELYRSQEIHRDRRPGDLPKEADRDRTVQARRV